ncbi:uncharacterized protein LOC130668564 [Microplitis mediator]|uniref:uncharacterized protein LOC130668564 n=1 Tax=Microplitis mediator TaxID=375433 RepID=UPI0025572043|nr:uncharacterized protein LOC130668564 [Microplitis mediator]
MEKSINSISPTDITKALTSTDIYDKNFEKNCYRIKIVQSNVDTYWKRNESVFKYEIIAENNILSSSDLINIYNTSIYENYDHSDNTSIQYINNDSVFVFNSSKIADSEIYGLAGSPLICNAPEKSDQFSLTGVLIDTINNLPMYFVVNGKWLEQKLNFLRTL